MEFLSSCPLTPEGIVNMTLKCSGLDALKTKFQTMDASKTFVLGTFPKMCYSFARYEAEKKRAGTYYVEGYATLASIPFMPIWHAWFMPDKERVIDGTVVEKEAVRKGILVPQEIFNSYMSDKEFVKRFEIYTEMPFHRACIDTGREITWV